MSSKKFILLFSFILLIILLFFQCVMPDTGGGGGGGTVVTLPDGSNPSKAIPLTENVWSASSISAGGVRWYYFNAVSGTVYRIQWDDSYQGSGSYTCDIKVSAYRENLTTSYFTERDSGFSTVNTITASATERVYIKVEGYDSSDYGTFAVKYISATNSGSLCYEPLDNNALKNVSSFNGKNIYTIGSPQPATKPESNSAPSTTYLWTIGTASSITGNIIAFNKKATESLTIMSDSTLLSNINDSSYPYSKLKRDFDTIVREKENRLLKSKSLQVPEYYAKSGIVKAAPSPITVGTTWDNVKIALTGNNINTTCRYISNKAYFFVDNRNYPSIINDSILAEYGTAFDAIWSINNSKFGSENDVDGNGKVIIVFSQELSGGVLGYFYAVDKFPKTTYSDSNEGDIFYITTEYQNMRGVIKGTLAHEHQHMIYFDQHYNRGVTSTYTWLNEALSQAAEYYTGYTDNHLAWISDFLNNGYAGLSLTHWTSGNYGYGALFIRYLIDRFGDTAIKNMCSTDKVGITAVETATGVDFNELFNDFTRAIVMSGTGDSTDPKYNFTTLNLAAVQTSGRGGLIPSNTYSVGNGYEIEVFAYRIVFFKWTGTFGYAAISSSTNYVRSTVFGLSR